jgi:hypothetical protein
MNWININDRQPDPYQEVIICSDESNVKSAIYMGNSKWSTFVPVAYWMPYPSPPDVTTNTTEAPIEAPKKKRGRPKKI